MPCGTVYMPLPHDRRRFPFESRTTIGWTVEHVGWILLPLVICAVGARTVNYRVGLFVRVPSLQPFGALSENSSPKSTVVRVKITQK
jgi:hypothetical protein